MTSTPNADASAGYETVASAFEANRERARIGAETVAEWARTLPPRAEVLELGCGAGVPVTDVLARAGCVVWGVDASPTLLASFRARFPDFRSACEDIVVSPFFSRTFDAAVAVGVLFLLDPAAQLRVIGRVAGALEPGGRFLFTAPASPVRWRDVLTGRLSQSLGASTYTATLENAGLRLEREVEDEGANHYFLALKDLAPPGGPSAG